MVFKLKLPPEAEAEDAIRREAATPRHIKLAWVLQRSGGARMDGAEPAPLYLAQAFAFLSDACLRSELFHAMVDA